MTLRIAAALITLAVVTGCGGSGKTIAQGGCPITQPSGPTPPAAVLLNGDMPMGKPSDPGWYGNGVLWTHVPMPAQFIRTPSGLLSTKIPWFRARNGTVTVTGEPLHGPPARFAANVGSPASYGPTGFAPSILAFGRTGCWVIHAHLANRVLDVVMRVQPAT